MEELILKLTQAINDFNKYLKNEYSSINKNFSGIGNSIGDYSVFTVVSPKLDGVKINKTFPRANFIMVSIDNPNDKIYLSINALTKEKLEFRDGSKFEGIFSDLYLTYDFSSYGLGNLPKVQIYIGYNSKYTPITNVKIADVDSNNPLPVTISAQGFSRYGVKGFSGTLNANSIQPISMPTTIDGKIVTGISSILITNLDNTNDLYFGNINDIADVGDCTPISAGEKLSVPFNPSGASFSFTLASASGGNYQYTIQYTYTM